MTQNGPRVLFFLFFDIWIKSEFSFIVCHRKYRLLENDYWRRMSVCGQNKMYTSINVNKNICIYVCIRNKFMSAVDKCRVRHARFICHANGLNIDPTNPENQ